MKTLFQILVFSMLMCMFVVMSHAQIPQMDILMGATVKIGNKWESKINPAESYGNWPTLSSYRVSANRVFAITGNPKIDWTKIDIQKFRTALDLCKQMAVPGGETASVVVFLFAIYEGSPYLMEYAYVDDLGVICGFKLDSEEGIYKQAPAPEQNQL